MKIANISLLQINWLKLYPPPPIPINQNYLFDLMLFGARTSFAGVLFLEEICSVESEGAEGLGSC